METPNKALWEVSCETRNGRIESRHRAADRLQAMEAFKLANNVVEASDPQPLGRSVVGSQVMAIQL